MWLSQVDLKKLYDTVAHVEKWPDDTSHDLPPNGFGKLDCIRYVRNTANCGMLEAKLYVERVWNYEIDSLAQPDGMLLTESKPGLMMSTYTDVHDKVHVVINALLREMTKALASNLTDSDRLAFIDSVRDELQIIQDYLKSN